MKDIIYLEGKNLYFQNNVLLGQIFTKEDGYYAFWPEPGEGYWPAYLLRAIADLLDERNKKWDEEINAYFDKMKLEDDLASGC